MSQRSSINDATATLTARFTEILSDLKRANLSETQEKLDALFRSVLEVVKSAGVERAGSASMFGEIERLKSENRRLKTLYATGLALTTQTQKEPLVEIALDIVVRELQADAGFVVLVDEHGEIQSVFSRNIEPEKH
ncbi:MAG: hypothetical protein ACUVRP_09965, partial [Chlorobiales bacterium]